MPLLLALIRSSARSQATSAGVLGRWSEEALCPFLGDLTRFSVLGVHGVEDARQLVPTELFSKSLTDERGQRLGMSSFEGGIPIHAAKGLRTRTVPYCRPS